MSDDAKREEELEARIEKLLPAVLPYAMERRAAMKGKRFVHYTTAECGLNIIRGQQLWLRDVRCMNDFSEVRYGYDVIGQWFSTGNNREIFRDTVKSLGDGVADEVLKRFVDWFTYLTNGTFIFCLSEHDGGKEDDFGRLSMWRSYGQGVSTAALVFNIPLDLRSRTLGVSFVPVDYRESIEPEMDRVLSNMIAHRDALREIPREVLIGLLTHVLILTTVSFKHGAFLEEKEWRVVHIPSLVRSTVLNPAVETIRSVPQVVYKLPLIDRPDEQIVGIALPKLLDRVIIGPTQFPGPIADAFSHVLTSIRIENPASRIVLSNIPLRV